MKKNFFSLGLIAVAAFTLTNCAKEITPGQEPEYVGIPFEITASTTQTKTTNDGLNTKWAEGDALNVFHAVAGGTDYVSDGSFTYSSENLFIGTLASELTAASYNWYAFYPYSSYIATPANTNSGFVKVGSNATQIGNNSMAHLDGDFAPMYGIAENVSSEDTPSVSMKHLTTVLAFNITNNSNKPLTVSTIKITLSSDVKIGGTFFVDFSSDEIVYTTKTAYNNATLYVNDGEELAIGASAKFYMPLKPFTATLGTTITYEINGYKQTVTLDKGVTFEAGHIKTINCVYDEQIVELSNPLTSNIQWTVSKDNKSYSEKAIINGTDGIDVLKLGTSSVIGSATIVIPSGTKKVGFYGVAWNGKSGKIQACADIAKTEGNADGKFFEQELKSNTGASSTSPYTITVSDDNDYYEIVVKDVLGVESAPSDITVTLKSVSGATRVILWGINSYAE